MRRKSGHAQIDAYEGVVIASDEAGYGSWAGPLVVCAVAAPVGWEDTRVKDSKVMTAKDRMALKHELSLDPRFVIEVYMATAKKIDELGVYTALLRGHEAVHKNVAERLGKPHISVLDGKFPMDRFSFAPNDGAYCLPKADALIPECGLASIIAKSTHDELMGLIHREHPHYGFDTNVGYGGNEESLHARKLMELGPCPEHRRSYQPVALAIQHREAALQPSLEEMFKGLDED